MAARNDKVIRGIRTPLRSGTMIGRISGGDGNAEEIGFAELLSSLSISFLNLTDTPASYSGQAGFFISVNVGETGLEFSASSGGLTHQQAMARVSIGI